MSLSKLMAGEHEFDIYQSESGYVAVTNPVRRQILAALIESDQELPDLVKLTGKAKPTLSNLHVRELLQQNLVQELPHPTDSRRKVYRLKGRRIGQSNVPLEALRGAVKQYVTTSPNVFTLPLPRVLEVLVLAGGAPREALVAQGRALGEACAHAVAVAGPRDLLTAVAAFWEREEVARAGRIDLDHLELEVEVQERFCGTRVSQEAVGAVFGGFLQGVAKGRVGIDAVPADRWVSDRRLVLKVTPK